MIVANGLLLEPVFASKPLVATNQVATAAKEVGENKRHATTMAMPRGRAGVMNDWNNMGNG
jgi:hypothetical protein